MVGSCLVPSLLALLLAPLQTVPPPSFSAPTGMTNPWAPFTPGSVKVFRGRADGQRTATLETHLAELRVFTWGGVDVPCRVIEEQEFADGALVEITRHYVAQDDAGNVRYFGEVSLVIEGGVVVETEEDSWLVGGPSLPGDPADVHAAEHPTMFMPADPQPGQSFQQEDFEHHAETLVVLARDVPVRVAAGAYERALKLRELDDGEDGGASQQRWVVAGVGLVKEVGPRTRTELLATSLLETDLD